MASFSGILQRPIVAASAVAITSVSTDLHEKFWPSKSIENSSSEALQEKKTSWVSQISVSKLANLSFVNRIRVPVPNISVPSPSISSGFVSNLSCSAIGISSVLVNFYQSASLAKSANPSTYTYTVPYSPSEVLYRWHLPEPNAVDISGNSDCSSVKSRTVVVLLGWLGAKQKHLKRYAEWYASAGYHVITFTFPMSEILSYQVGGKAEQDIELLVNHLVDWLEEEHGKNLVFHTFSNTGWLT